MFNTSSSTSYSISNATLSNLEYGSASVSGYYATDFISLDTTASTEITGFEFFAMASQVGISDTFDGIVGFGRQYTTDGGREQGPLFLENAKAAGTITDEIIAFYLSGTDGNSLVDVGSYDTNNIKDADSSRIVWFPMPDE